ncbi:DoxX family protein [Ilumatobacter sp.]|uniref:DoxX family protein n=1 Tax=Ilumatobacter sp. TaxID=1967498 RepID=UPI0037523D3C
MTEHDLALFLVRVALGLTMAAHGANKFRSGLAGVAGWFDSMGMRPGALHARFAAGGEVLAGLFLAAGLLTSFAALGFVGLMTVAAVTVHLSKGFFILDEGWEYVFILGVTAVAIALLGPGGWSIDRAIGIDDDLDGWLGLAIAAGGGLAAAGGLLSVFYRPPTGK